METDGYYWDRKLGYLLKSRRLYHNDDYLRFLVRDVWGISKPVKIADYGCGYGYLGIKFMAYLPTGSTYIGIDKGAELIEKAKGLFKDSEYQHVFINQDILSYEPEQEADISMTHTVLMHMKDPARMIRKMIDHTADGGRIICCETNWIGAMSLIHLNGMEQTEYVDLSFLQEVYKRGAEESGKDGNIGIKLPIYFAQNGLRNIEIRMSDRVNYYSSERGDTENQELFEAMVEEGIAAMPKDDESIKKNRKRLQRLGFTRGQIEGQLSRERRINDYVEEKKVKRIVFGPAMMFASGIVCKKDAT